MNKPPEFLQGFGIGAGLIGVAAALTLLFRPAPPIAGAARQARAGKPVIEPRGASHTAAALPPDYLDLCRRAGL